MPLSSSVSSFSAPVSVAISIAAEFSAVEGTFASNLEKNPIISEEHVAAQTERGDGSSEANKGDGAADLKSWEDRNKRKY
jgi:hypothetical protein